MIKYIQYNYIIVIKYIDILQIESGSLHQIHTYIHKIIHQSIQSIIEAMGVEVEK